MKRLKQRHGLTMVELIVVIAMASIVAVLVGKSLGRPLQMLQDHRIRSAADSEARSAMSLMSTSLRTGIPGTVEVNGVDLESTATPPASGIPNSHIRFRSQTNNKLYDFYLTEALPHVLRFRETDTIVRDSKTLCNNVSNLSFGVDFRDPSVVIISLRVEVPLDAKRTHVIDLSNQSVRLGNTL